MPRIVSIQTGQPQSYGNPAASDPAQQVWTTAFFKSPVAGEVLVSRLGLEGDGQADLRVHGGPDKAILAYSDEHYAPWRSRLQRPEIGAGAFGENLTIAELTERTVCIGDTWRIGDVLLQVSQPRQPCWKLARRWQIPELPKLVVQTGFSGWYFRVLREGKIAPGMEMELQVRPHPQWSIDRASQALYSKNFPVDEGYELAGLPELSPAWQEDLLGRLGTRD